MKIYKNPDGPDLDILYPTLFFASFGFIIFFLFKTCISSDQFWGLGLVALVGSYSVYYYLNKKKKTKKSTYANLFLASTGTPVLVAIALAFNYFISFELYQTKAPIKGHVVIYEHSMYVLYDDAPELCPKIFELSSAQAIYQYNYIETKINKGIFGFPVLKYHRFTMD